MRATPRTERSILALLLAGTSATLLAVLVAAAWMSLHGTEMRNGAATGAGWA